MSCASTCDQQKARRIAFENFNGRLPATVRHLSYWSHFLHLARRVYTSPFAAILSIEADKILVIDWADNRLDGANSDFVEQVEAQTRLARALAVHSVSAAAVVSGDWLAARLRFFCGRPDIALAVHVQNASRSGIDTAPLHSIETVISDFLSSAIDHAPSRAAFMGRRLPASQQALFLGGEMCAPGTAHQKEMQ